MVRLYIPETLKAQAIIPLNEDQIHYLRNVLRYGPDDPLTVFNGNGGEWRAKIHTLSKSRGDITIIDQIRPPRMDTLCWISLCPFKA